MGRMGLLHVLRFAFGLTILGVASVAIGADAPEPLGLLLKGFEDAARSISQKMVAEGGKLLFLLGTIQIAWNSVQLLLKGEFGLEAAMGVMLRPMISLAMWAAFILMAPTWIPQIINGWMGLGASVSGARALNPGEIFLLGLDLALAMVDSLKGAIGADSYLGLISSPYAALQIGLLSLILIGTFIILAGQVAMAMIKAYLWLAIAPMLMGFGGLKNTQDIALHTMKSAISIGVVIVTTYIIISVGLKMEPTWRSLINNVTLETMNTSVWYVIASALLIALAAWQVPKIANDFINGSVSGGVSEAAGMAITGAAAGVAAASGAAALGSMAASGAQTGTSNLAALTSLANSAFGDARDHGKSGIEGVTHAFGSALEAGGAVFQNAFATGVQSAKDWATAGASDTVPGQMASAVEAGRGGSIGAGPNFDVGGAGGAGGAGGGGGAGAGAPSSGSDVGSSGASRSASVADVSGGGAGASASGGSASGGFGGASGGAMSPQGLAATDFSTNPGSGADQLSSESSSGAAAQTGASSEGGDMPADDGNPLPFVDWNRTDPDPLVAEVFGDDVAAAVATGNASGASLSGPSSNSDSASSSWAERLSSLSHDIGSTREYLPEGGDGTVQVSANLQGGHDV